MRAYARLLSIVAVVLGPAHLVLCVDDSDVLFFAPYEGSTEAAIAGGGPHATVTGAEQFVPGVRGQAVLLDAGTLLTYAFAGNVIPDEGTIMLWFRPEWPAEDELMHMLFRASTGNDRGKALNAIYLYKYARWARLQAYTSNGQLTGPQEGRSLAYRDDVHWEPGTWQHAAMTWSATLENTEMYLYLNGERIAACAGQVFVPDEAPATFDICGPEGAGTTAFDDVLVFGRPLLAEEIRSIYEAYAAERVADAAELPFVPTQELHLRAWCLFPRDELVVLADYRGARRDLGQTVGTVEVTATGTLGRATASADTAPGGVARLALSLSAVGPGPANLTATLRGGNGEVLRTGELALEVPPRPEWLGNQLGITDEVLPPWTPVRAQGDTVSIWGREYRFATSPLPAQVVSGGRELLRAPIALRAGNALLEAPPQGALDVRNVAARGRFTGSLGSLSCTARSSVEYDGFMRVDLTLTPGARGNLDGLELVVPLRAEVATLYHHCNGEWTALSDAGAVGAGGWSKPLPFVPYVWVGDESGGLAWWCESNWNWRNAEPDRAVELRHTAEGVDLVVRFADEPVTLDGPLELTFGFMATPVKPLPERWRDWRTLTISALDIDAFAQRGSWAFDGCRNIGVLWNNHVGSFSYLPAEPAEMARKVEVLRAHHWPTVLSYYAMNCTQTGSPDFVVNEHEWRRDPYREATMAHGTYGSVCQASSWADALLWIINRTMDETGTDGVYVDCSSPHWCRSVEHGCERGRYPLLATRELQQRMYTLVRQKRGDNGFVFSHVSESVFATTYAFADAILNGEQYNKKDLLTDLTLEKFRAEFLPTGFGIPQILLPTLVKFQPEGREKMPGSQFLGFPLLHDVICVPSWMNRESQMLLRDILVAMRAFDVADSEFLPYWANRDVIAVSGDALVSAYRHRGGDRLLLVAQAVTGDPLELTVTLRGALTGLTGSPARDALSGEPLAWRDGRLVWPLPGRAVQLAVIGEQ